MRISLARIRRTEFPGGGALAAAFGHFAYREIFNLKRAPLDGGFSTNGTGYNALTGDGLPRGPSEDIAILLAVKMARMANYR